MLDPVPLTAEQLLAIDEPGQSHELVRGELRPVSNAGWWHGAVAAAVCEFLRHHVREHHLGLVFAAETGFVLARRPDTVRSPDAAFVRSERLPGEPGRGYFEGAPDLAVEVTSPHDGYDAVHDKASDWLDRGAEEVWIVASGPRHVTVLRADGRAWLCRAEDRVRSELLPHIQVAVREFFPTLA